MEEFDNLFFKEQCIAAPAAEEVDEAASIDDISSSSSSSSSSSKISSSGEDSDDDSSGLSVSSCNDSDHGNNNNDESFRSILENSKNSKKKKKQQHHHHHGKENRIPSSVADTSRSIAASATASTTNGDSWNKSANCNNNYIASPSNGTKNINTEDDTEDDHDDHDDDYDDDDDLVEIFSRSSPIPSVDNDEAGMSVKNWKKESLPLYREQEEHGDNVDNRVDPSFPTMSSVVANSHNHNDHFDSLDMDALAELDENDSVHEEGNAMSATMSATKADEGTTTATTTTTITSPLNTLRNNNFTITYNCEKKECVMVDEDLFDSSDDEEKDDENMLAQQRKKNSRSSDDIDDSHQHYEKRNANSGTMENLIDFEKMSATVEKSRSGSSPTSSLDTPREMECPSPPPQTLLPTSYRRSMTGSLQEDATANPTTRVIKPGTNPYHKTKSNTRQLKEKNGPLQSNTKLIDLTEEELSLESPRELLPRGSNTNDITPSVSNNSTKSVATTQVVTLPDIGLSPDAHLSELQRFGIDHSHTAPPPHTPRPDPIIHKFTNQNRPHQSRRNIAVDTVFSSPVNNLWKKSNKFHSFNHLQSEMVNVLANSDDNVIVSAPTGAGKTVLFEMAMARLLASNIHWRGGGVGGTVSKAQKILYLAPNKALCEERQLDWSKRLFDIDRSIICTTITGGPNTTSPSTSFADIASSHVIITTTEKWDSITRRWNEQFVLLASIKLVLVDEVHMIGEPDRGGCLESVICRMKTIQRVARAKMLTGLDIASSSYKYTTPSALASSMRIVAVSATLPNIGHLASFVESGEAYSFDQSYRPVPLNVFVQACGHIGSNRYLFDKSLNQHVPSILKRFSSGRPAIVFCHSKKETEELAGELTKSYVTPSTLNESALVNYSSMTDTSALHQCIRKGIAFHHAGLDASDRRLVEQAFVSGSISCLCATSTLAMGVNLPSHLVVVKGTSAYRGASEGHQDIDTGTLLQMMGRAGRPGFDTSGTAVIMTDTLSKTRFENMSQGLKVVESHLMDDNRLTEVLNIEISQGVITSVEDAVNWVKGTFLYRRIQSHPLFYGFNGNGVDIDTLHSFVLGKCADSIDKLRKILVIEMKDDATFTPTPGCHVMSRNFIDFETMRDIIKLPHNSGPVQLLHMISNCSKIQTPVRRHEKKALNEAYKRIKYKLEGPQSKIRIQTPAEKSFVMLQSAIGRHYFEEFALRQQMTNIIDGASQVLSAIEQYAKEGSRNGQLATQSMLFRRSLFSSLWSENDGVLNQINGVTHEISANLIASGISTFADVLRSSCEDIVNACNVSSAFASSLRDAASTILQRTLKLSACSKDNDGELSLHVRLDRKVTESIEETSEKIVSYSLIIFTDRAGGLLHYSENITKACEITLQCSDNFGRAYICLVSNLVGLDEQVTVDGNGDLEMSPALLSRSVSKPTTTKGKKQRQQSIVAPPPSHKRPLDSHRNSVSNVDDLRLQKRGKVQKESVGCTISEPLNSEAATQSCTSTKNLVTPSPHPHTKHQNLDSTTPRRNVTSLSVERNEVTNNSQAKHHPGQSSKVDPSFASSRFRRGGQTNSRTSWFKEKSHQKTAQQTAFNSPKENPFASYSFDPNNIEHSLDSNANKSTEHVPTQSIIPNINSNSSYFAESSRYSQSFRTPGNRRKSTAISNRISSVSVLQQKATELQQHHSQMVAPRYTVGESYNNSGYPTYDGRSVRGYEMFPESDHFNDPGMMPQSTYFHDRPGTSTGNIMQRPFIMEPNAQTHPFYNGCSNDLRIPQNNTFMRGPVAANQMAVPSFLQRPTSRIHANNPHQNMMYRANSHPYQLYDFQLQNELQLHRHENTDQYPGYHHGMNQQRLYDNPMSDHSYHGFDPLANHVDYSTTGEFYGRTVGNASIPGHSSYEGVGGIRTSVFQSCPFGNRNTHTQPSIQSVVGASRNPYQQYPPRQQQASLPMNPYKTKQHQQQHQQQQPVYYSEGVNGNDYPPMQEVVVQNNSVRSGLAGDDASRFDEAFL